MSWIAAPLILILKISNIKLRKSKKSIVKAGNGKKKHGDRVKLVGRD